MASVGVLERHGRHPDETLRMTPDDGRHVLVLHPREGPGGPRFRPVAEHHRRRREHLAVDSEPIHVLDPPLRAPRPVVDLAEDGFARHDRGPTRVAMDQPRPAAAAVPAGEVLPALGQHVRVEVDPHQGRPIDAWKGALTTVWHPLTSSDPGPRIPAGVPSRSAVPPTTTAPFVHTGQPRLTAGSLGWGLCSGQPPRLAGPATGSEPGRD